MAPMYAAIFFIWQAILARAQPGAQPARCLKPRPENTGCKALKPGASPITFWYFDQSTLTCLAAASDDRLVFGDHSNNVFRSWVQCASTCIPADAPLCSPTGQVGKNEQGEPIVCARQPGPAAEHGKCPEGFRCQNAAFFAICCNATAEDEYERNVRPFCPNGKKAVLANMENTGDPGTGLPQVQMPLLGKVCTDGHCPAGTKCVQMSLFAHCCGTEGAEPDGNDLGANKPSELRAGCPPISTSQLESNTLVGGAKDNLLTNDQDVHLQEVVQRDQLENAAVGKNVIWGSLVVIALLLVGALMIDGN